MSDDQLDLIFKALSDRTRRRIIDHLSKRPAQSLFEVCAASIAEDGIAEDGMGGRLLPRGRSLSVVESRWLAALPALRSAGALHRLVHVALPGHPGAGVALPSLTALDSPSTRLNFISNSEF